MKRGFVYAAMLALMPVSLLASTKPQTVTIVQPVMFGSTQLAPGDYRVTWEGAGPIVHVTILHGKTSATADAKLVTENNGQTGVVFTNQGATKIVNEIELRHVSLLLQDQQSGTNQGR